MRLIDFTTFSPSPVERGQGLYYLLGWTQMLRLYGGSSAFVL